MSKIVRRAPIERALFKLPENRLSENSAQPVRALLRKSGRIITYHRRFVDLLPDQDQTGNSKTALFLSQAIYWIRHGTLIEESGGWFSKTADQWQLETGLSRREVDTARRRLRAAGLLDEKKAGAPPLPFYRIDLERLGQMLAERIGRSLPHSLSVDILRQSKVEWVRQLLGPIVPFNRILVDVCHSTNAALYLSQAIRAQASAMSLNAAAQGWDLRPTNKVTLETGLTRHQQDAARKQLRDLGFLVEAITGVPPRRYSFVDLVQIGCAIQAIVDVDYQSGAFRKNEESSSQAAPRPSLALSGKSYRHIPANRLGGFQKILNRKILNTGFLITNLPHTPKPSIAVAGGVLRLVSVTPKQSELIFPKWLSSDEVLACQQALIRAPSGKWQILLDELDGQKSNMARRKPICNPVAYLRTLATQAHLGSFVPELAFRVSKARDQAAEVARVKAAAEVEFNARVNSGVTAPASICTNRERDCNVSIAAVSQMRAMLKKQSLGS